MPSNTGGMNITDLLEGGRRAPPAEDPGGLMGRAAEKLSERGMLVFAGRLLIGGLSLARGETVAIAGMAGSGVVFRSGRQRWPDRYGIDPEAY